MNVRKNIKKKFPPSPKTDLGGGGGGGGGGGRGPGYASGPGNSGQGDVPACRDLGTQVPPGTGIYHQLAYSSNEDYRVAISCASPDFGKYSWHQLINLHFCGKEI